MVFSEKWQITGLSLKKTYGVLFFYEDCPLVISVIQAE